VGTHYNVNALWCVPPSRGVFALTVMLRGRMVRKVHCRNHISISSILTRRLHRRYMHRVFDAAQTPMFLPQILRGRNEFLQQILRNHERFASHLRQWASLHILEVLHLTRSTSMTGSLLLRIAYGLEIQPEDDPLINLAERTLERFVYALVPGKFLVVRLFTSAMLKAGANFFQDALPWLKYIPSWFPGANFKRQAKIWRKDVEDMMEVPYQAVREGMVRWFNDAFITRNHVEAIIIARRKLPCFIPLRSFICLG
jgi:hypothetical protein